MRKTAEKAGEEAVALRKKVKGDETGVKGRTEETWEGKLGGE